MLAISATIISSTSVKNCNTRTTVWSQTTSSHETTLNYDYESTTNSIRRPINTTINNKHTRSGQIRDKYDKRDGNQGSGEGVALTVGCDLALVI